jgi:small-conductance mechanosensitive channel
VESALHPRTAMSLPFLTDETEHQLLLTAAWLAAIFLARTILVYVVRGTVARHPNGRHVFWTRQTSALITVIAVVVVLSSIWLNSPERMTTIFGFVSAGLAFSLQRTITAFVGYLIVLRGRTFTVGDRISMGGVRGDVIDLGFLQTRIMEIGAPRDAQDTPIWIRDRQYTGRIVMVTNDNVFEEPVYNYTREFPFLWEEISVCVSHLDERQRIADIMLDAARVSTRKLTEAAIQRLDHFRKKYLVHVDTLEPAIYYHFDSDQLVLIVRFIATVRDERDVKSDIKRRIVDGLHAAGLTADGKVG